MAKIHPVDNWSNLYMELEKADNHPINYAFNECIKLQYFQNKDNDVETKLKNFISEIKDNYQENYYHSFLHALHVFKSSIVLWNNLCNRVCFDFTHIDHLAILISALIHDVCHPGGFNSLLIGKNNKLANMYNDQSILENQSLTFAFELLSQNQYNFLINLSDKEVQQFRKMVIELVLGTDIGNDIRNIYLNAVSEKYDKLYGSIDTEQSDGKLVAMTYLLRCADVCAGMQSNEVSWIWAERFYSECYTIFNGPPGTITDTYTNQIIHIKNNSLKLVQNIIKLKILNTSFEELILNNINNNLASWKEHAQSKITSWKNKLNNT